MPTGTSKERVIKENLDLCIERTRRDLLDKKMTRGEFLKEDKRAVREYTKAAYEADRISKG